MALDLIQADDNPLWYKDGVIYQVHIKAFKDSNGDGTGDINGIIEKLDYIQSLGINILWLLPFYPSPMKDDGYDTADYYNINPAFGNLEDFKKLLREAHKRDIRVVTELVLNHTSDQHAWFQRARRAKPGSPERDFYVWSDTTEKYKEARIIFKDFELSNWTWDHTANAYYWHRFYSHQPDLNFDNPEVHKQLLKVVDFWFEMGVDGLRLDAVPYLYEREGTNCENLPETHAFLRKLNEHVRTKFENKMLLAEANQWPEDAVAYFGNGDECHMAFHFPVMPRMYMSIMMENRFPIIDILEQTPPIPENCQWAMFLRNHDELTLEMVTDEERDFMYRSYAKDNRARINLGIRRRLAPLVENNRRKIELLNIMLFSFPGTPIVYYGDEIGMGDNYYLGDRNGVRTPMQWSPDRNAGFSAANPQRLFLPVITDPEYNYETINVEVQQRSPSSLLWWMRRAISVRKNYKAFGRGDIEFLSPSNTKVLAFYRKYEDEVILAVVNLSRFPQVVELDLGEYAGYSPVEMFSRNKFPVIREGYYMLTLNPYDYYWFSLNKKPDAVHEGEERKIPEITIGEGWQSVLTEKELDNFEQKILQNYFYYHISENLKEVKIQRVKITDQIRLNEDKNGGVILIAEVEYIDNPSELYLLPAAYAEDEKARRIINENSREVYAKIRGEEERIIFNGFYDEEFSKDFLNFIISKKNVNGGGKLSANLSKDVKKFYKEDAAHIKHYIKRDEISYNIVAGEANTIKIYRKLEEGDIPSAEMLRLLSDRGNFENVPGYGGQLVYTDRSGNERTAGLFLKLNSTLGSGWSYFFDAAAQYYESVSSKDPEELAEIEKNNFAPGLFATFDEGGNTLCDIIDKLYIDHAEILGERTGEMHNLLGSFDDDVYAPEDFSMFYQRSIYQSTRTSIKNAFRLLERETEMISPELRDEAEEVLGMQDNIHNMLNRLLQKKINAKKIRVHGDFHLKQVVFTGKDFIIKNFEGLAGAAISERKLKRSPLRDIASMIWSLQFAAYNALYKYKSRTKEDIEKLEPYAQQWWYCMSGAFFNKYYKAAGESGYFPENREDLDYLLKIYMTDKMMHELIYAVTHQKDWLIIPLKGIKQLMAHEI